MVYPYMDCMVDLELLRVSCQLVCYFSSLSLCSSAAVNGLPVNPCDPQGGWPRSVKLEMPDTLKERIYHAAAYVIKQQAMDVQICEYRYPDLLDTACDWGTFRANIMEIL